MITRQRRDQGLLCERIFAAWLVFKDQWRRYLVAISLLMLVALFTVIPQGGGLGGGWHRQG